MTRYVAFYLPQFYPFPENDAWWGKGFTEWTNVTKARPLFEGHDQPHLPTDLGFYDLRLRETQHEQIALAKAYGVDAFCFHYYWFSGKRLLEHPVDAFLADAAADMPFCLCWANENWTRRWDAAEKEVLIAQRYEPGWEDAFIDSVAPFLRDPRYLRVKGRPLLIVYRPQHIPDARASAARWREYCRQIGMGEIHIVAAMVHGNWDYAQYGFDAGVEFPPHNMAVRTINDAVKTYAPFEGVFVEYGEVARDYLGHRYEDRPIYRTVFPSWDNTARVKERALAVLGASPDNYERWLRQATVLTEAERAPDEQLVFINAWNEWAEGCHLEPDRSFGRGYLEATRRVKRGESRLDDLFAPSPFAGTALPPVTPDAARRDQALKHGVRNLLARQPRLLAAATALYGALRRLKRAMVGAAAVPAVAEAPALPRALRSVALATAAPAAADRESFLAAREDAVFTAFPARDIRLEREIEVVEGGGAVNGAKLRELLAETHYAAQPMVFGRFHEAIVHPRAISLVTRGGDMIAETARVYGFIDRGYEQVSHLKFDFNGFTQTAGATHVIDEQVLFPMHASFAFGHCMLDAMPQILYWSDEIAAGRMKIALSDKVPAWLRGILETWGFGRQHFMLLPDEPTLFRSAIVSDSLSSLATFFPNPDTIRQYRDSLPAQRATPGGRLYLRRDPGTSYSGRSIENEAELMAMLEGLGFRIVDPAALPYGEQRDLFADAAMVIGAHGSAFANLVWCATGTRVIDLMADDWVGYWRGGVTERWLSRLTGVCELDYSVMLCASRTQPSTDATRQAWPDVISVVDVAQLKERLCRQMSLQPV